MADTQYIFTPDYVAALSEENRVLRSQLIVAIEDSARLRAERDDLLAKVAGFTAEDVAAIEGAADDLCQEFGKLRVPEAEYLHSLASRIEALLPPPPSSERDPQVHSLNPDAYAAWRDPKP